MSYASGHRFRDCLRKIGLFPCRGETRQSVVIQPLEQIQCAIQRRAIGHPVQLIAAPTVNATPAATIIIHNRSRVPPADSIIVNTGASTSSNVLPDTPTKPVHPHCARSIKFDGRTYHFDLVLGEGAFGTVKMARVDGRTVAVKIINRERFLIDDVPVAAGIDEAGGFVSDIAKERNALVVANAAGSYFLPKVEAFFQDYRFFYTVMPLYPMSLAERLEELGAQDLAMPLAEFKLKAAEMISGISALHLHGCFHCDIKPDNIMLSQEGHIVLVDFGIAEVGSGLLDGGARGTPGYIAPEIKDGRMPYYSAHAADIYSLGVVFLQMYLCPCSTGDIFTDKGNVKLGPYSSQHNDKNARGMIRVMMEPDPEKRVPIGQVKVHPFFVASIDWYRVERLGYQPTYVPTATRTRVDSHPVQAPMTPKPSPHAKPLKVHLSHTPKENRVDRRTPQTGVRGKTPVKQRQPTPGRTRKRAATGGQSPETKRTKVAMVIPIPNAEGKI